MTTEENAPCPTCGTDGDTPCQWPCPTSEAALSRRHLTAPSDHLTLYGVPFTHDEVALIASFGELPVEQVRFIMRLTVDALRAIDGRVRG